MTGNTKMSIGIGLILFTIFISWICEFIASYYSAGGGKLMEYIRTMVALLILLEVLFLTLPTERTSFMGGA